MSLAVSKDTQVKRARLYPDVIHLHLDEAKLCANCDTLHTGTSCPTCTSTNCVLLSSIIGRMSQSLHMKTHLASLHNPAKDADNGFKRKSVPENKNGAGLKFLLMQLTSWLK